MWRRPGGRRRPRTAAAWLGSGRSRRDSRRRRHRGGHGCWRLQLDGGRGALGAGTLRAAAAGRRPAGAASHCEQQAAGRRRAPVMRPPDDHWHGWLAQRGRGEGGGEGADQGAGAPGAGQQLAVGLPLPLGAGLLLGWAGLAALAVDLASGPGAAGGSKRLGAGAAGFARQPALSSGAAWLLLRQPQMRYLGLAACRLLLVPLLLLC
jgi:hypothetical protein